MSNVSAYMSSVATYLKLPVIASSGLALLLSGALYFKQNEIIYPRDLPAGSRADKHSPSRFGITEYEEVSIPTPDGETLAAYLVKPADCPDPKPVTVLMFHGNAGNISHRLPIAEVLESKLGCTVLLLEYRGYGQSTGTPNEKGLQVDAQAGLDYVLSRPDLKDSNVVVYGQSLGGAVAIHLAAKKANAGKIKAMILENTFLSIRKMIPSAFPPARYLASFCHEIWPSDEVLPTVDEGVPVLFLSGRKDEIVPPEHMDQLFRLCRARDKEFVEFADGTHNSTVEERKYFGAIHRFLNNHIYRPMAAGSAGRRTSGSQGREKEREREREREKEKDEGKDDEKDEDGTVGDADEAGKEGMEPITRVRTRADDRL